MWNYEELESSADVGGAFFLPQSIGKFVRFCLYQYSELCYGLGDIGEAEFNRAIASYREGSMIGQLVFTFGELPDFCLPCDGGLHTVAAYPELAEILGSTLGFFNCPNLEDTLITGGDNPNETSGNDEVTLSVDELPEHSHAIGLTPEPLSVDGLVILPSVGVGGGMSTAPAGSGKAFSVKNHRTQVRIGIIAQ